MAGSNDDIERLLREMDALTAQADDVLGGDDPTGTSVAKRRSSEPAPQAKADVPARAAGEREGLPPAVLRALVVSGVATAIIWVLFIVLPFIGVPILSLFPVFLSSLLVAAFYTLRGRGK
ncbi:MAG: hypothetical protein WCA29_12475 [Jiangellales bacterium]